MASGLSHHLLCFHSLQSNLPSKSQTLRRNPNCAVRLRAVRRSSPRKNPSTLPETSAEESKPLISPKRSSSPDPDPQSDSSFFSSFSVILRSLRDKLKVDELGLEILSIALPAALALAADPITSLVDTAFVGHLGSVELAAVGVSVSVFNLVSKLFNVPLLNITTSFVAEEQALASKGDNDAIRNGPDHVGDYSGKKLLPSVSTSLALAACIGIAEAVALYVGSGFLMNIMGFTNANTS